MINVKKGTAHSLQQADIRGFINPAYAAGTVSPVIAGQICNVDSKGYVSPGTNTVAGASAGLRGFAINNAADGDAIESNKIALYTLDGNSIIETDQVAAVDSSNSAATLSPGSSVFKPGVPVYADASTGLATLYSNSGANAQIGIVEGVRYLTRYGSSQVNASATTQANTVSATEAGATQNASGIPGYNATTYTAAYKPQVNVPVLSIKLIAGA